MRKVIFSRFSVCIMVLVFAVQVPGYSQQAATVTETLKEGEQVGVPTQKESALPAQEKVTVPAINPYDIAIPEVIGRVEEVFQGAPDSPLIIHVQDAHANYEAQKNIKQILDHLRRNFLVKLIQLEGAASKLDPSVFAISYLKEANQKLADFLMRQGRLSGAEAFAIESEHPVELYGVEDATLYIENLKTFRSVYSHQKELDAYFNEMRLVAKDLRVKLLNEELLDLVRKMEEYSQEKIELLDYVLYLNALAEKHEVASLNDLTEITRFPNLVRILRLHELEKDVNEKALKPEAEALKQAFLDKGVTIEEKELVEKLDLSKKGMKPRIYFRRITALAERLDIDLLAYPKIRKFAEFLILQDEIEHRGLFGEVNRLERLLQKKMFKSREEQFLIDLVKGTELLTQYFKLEMNREKLAFVMKRYEKIKPSIIRKRLDYLANQYGVKPSEYKGDVSELDKLMDDVEYFYRVVIERDGHFISNVLNRMKESQTDRTVLITGGFHTDGVTRLLRKDNLSYIVVIPRIDVKQGPENYLKIMLESDTAVGSVFAGTFALAAAVESVKDLKDYIGNPMALIQKFAKVAGESRVFSAWVAKEQGTELDPAQMQAGIDKFNQDQGVVRVLNPGVLKVVAGTITVEGMRVSTPIGVMVIGLTLDGDKVNETIELESPVKPAATFPFDAVQPKLDITPLTERPAADIVPPTAGEALAQTLKAAKDVVPQAIVMGSMIVPGTDAELSEADLAEIARLPSGYAVQCFAQEFNKGRTVSEAVDQALARSTGVTASMLENVAPSGAEERLMVIPVPVESPMNAVGAQLVSVWQTLLANRLAGAVILGSGLRDIAIEMGMPRGLLERIEFVDVKTDKDLYEKLGLYNKTDKLSATYTQLLKTTADFQTGIGRILVPASLTSAFGALNPVTGVVQLTVPSAKADEAESVASVQVVALYALPTTGETPEQFQLRLRTLGLDELGGMVKFDGKVWSFTITEFVQKLYHEFQAARLVAIRA